MATEEKAAIAAAEDSQSLMSGSSDTGQWATRKEGFTRGLCTAGIAVLTLALIQAYIAGHILLPFPHNVLASADVPQPLYFRIAFHGTSLLARWWPLIVLAVAGLFSLHKGNILKLPAFIRGPFTLIAGGALLVFSSASIIAGFILLSLITPNLKVLRWRLEGQAAFAKVYSIRQLEDEYRAANPTAGFTCDLQNLVGRGAELPQSYAFCIVGCQGNPVSHYVVVARPQPGEHDSDYYPASRPTYCADQDGRLGVLETLSSKTCVVGAHQ